MPTVDFGRIESDASPEDVINALAKIQKGIDYLMQGGLDSKNAREFGGWLVGNTELQSRNKTVGMSTEDTAADDVRFWAGDVKTGSPNFKVTESGIASLVSALFKSAAGYPRVEINSTDNLVAAYSDVNNYVAIIPNYSAVPSVVMVDTGVTKAFMRRVAVSGLQIGTINSSEPVNIQTSGALQINGTNGWNSPITYVKDVVAGAPVYGTITVTKGLITNVT